MGLPKVSDWSDDVYQAGTRGGFNPLVHLKPELDRAYPDFQAYELMFSSEDDLKNTTSMGWVHLDYGMFDHESVQDFNKAVGLRYGMILDVHGHIKIGDNYIMIMPKKFRESIKLARKEALAEQNRRANNSAAYAHPSDPEYSKMQQGAQEIASETSSRYKVAVGGEPEDKPRRGRPPKNK